MAGRRRSDHIRLTMYISPVETGLIELLIHTGRYRTRSHVLRAALERFLRDLSRPLDTAIDRHGFEVGLVRITPEKIEGRERLAVIGTAVMDDSLTDASLDDLEQILVYGDVVASPAVTTHLGDRLVRRAAAQRIDDDD